MDRGDVLSGAAFKAVLRASWLFILVLSVMATLSLGLIDRMLTDELKLRIEGIEESLDELALDRGGAELADYLRTLASGGTMVFGLFDADGERIAGTLELREETEPWREVTMMPARGEAAERFLVHRRALGDLTVELGLGKQAEYSAARAAALRGFALTGFVVVLVMLSIGYALSRHSQEKLEAIQAALDGVARGETGVRVGDTGSDDQIGRIAAKIDGHLDQLDAMILQTRRTPASVAHDLRRPLARATLGMERALARVEAGDDARGDIEDSLADLGRLSSVVSAILRIARIESDEVGLTEVFDLRDVLDDVAETFRPVVEDAGQIFDYVRADEPLPIRGDRDMVAQLTVNLVQNAITYAGEGATVTVAGLPGLSEIRLRVSDTGPGIPEAQRLSVLEPFFRIDAARSIEGSGLGLALVRAIAERHGASLRLYDNAPGLRVKVRFPVADAA